MNEWIEMVPMLDDCCGGEEGWMEECASDACREFAGWNFGRPT